MKLVILSGRSGSGKSVALNALEDAGYYCIDNLPLELTLEVRNRHFKHTDALAISVDARNPYDLAHFTQEMERIKSVHPELKVVFIDANESVLLKRFSETRRRHPLTHNGISLREAMQQEEQLISPIRATADLVINTSSLTPHQLREQIRTRVTKDRSYSMDILFTSFGFKHGAPQDADFIFDARCLPNPHWVPELRPFTGRDQPIQEYLGADNQVMEYIWQLRVFLDTWLPEFAKQERSYFTFAVGCTGGQHRSVYIVEKLNEHFSGLYPNVKVSHRQLDKAT
ncbi:MAG: RNase adapter RapZ [Gammaproteobacteria bacterium]|nr:RNase adapter RapZ [Gammaproteobacteria bacterium]